MIAVAWEFVGLPQVNASLDSVSKGLDSLKPLWERFESQFHAEERELFSQAPWTPLSPSYAARKQREVGSKPILRVTDTLMESLTEPKTEGNITRINDDDAEFGSSIPYSIFHQFGTSRMPARPPIVEPDERVYTLVASQYLESMLIRAGFK